jgi:hypothetical protein
MAIRVTCPNCHARFNVSEKFAGKEGPCPKCKGVIRIPSAAEQVVIHAPAPVGPRDSQGGQILKPIRRKEFSLTSVQIALILVSIVGFFLFALILRMIIGQDIHEFPYSLIVQLAAICIAPPLGFVGYHLLRNQELGTFPKPELFKRIAIASLIYAILWMAFPAALWGFNNRYELGTYLTAIIPMLAVGGVVGMYCFDMEYLMGLVHYGLYFVICLIGRAVAGLGFLPSDTGTSVGRTSIRTTSMLENVQEYFLGLVALLT